jgi:hypothetical protein
MSSPLRSYVAAHKAQIKQAAFFCTQGGSGAEKVFRDLAQLCGQSPLATLAVNDREINGHTYAQQVERFAAALAGVDQRRTFEGADTASVVDAAAARARQA